MYYDDELLMQRRAARHRKHDMSDDNELDLDQGFIQAQLDVDPDTVGATKEDIQDMAGQISAVIKSFNCNALVVLQGEDGTMCMSDGNISPTKAVAVMQLICAGVFGGLADENDKVFLDALSQSLARRMRVEDSVPKIIYN